jgi:hypothetical protein
MNKVNYNDFDSIINMVYEAIYINKEKYEIQMPSFKEIKIDDVKKPLDFDYNKINFFKANFKYLFTLNKNIFFERVSKENKTLIMITIDNIPSTNIDDTNYNTNGMFHSYVASELVFNSITQHILINICNFNMKYEKNKMKELSQPIYKEIGDKYKDGNNLLFRVFEDYTDSEDLESYLLRNRDLKTFSVILFQILYTIQKLYDYYGIFRFNGITINNLIIQKNINKEKYIEYKLGDVIFKIPNIGYDIKIYDFSQSYNKNYNKKMDCGIECTDNMYFDIHYLLNNLYFFLKENKINIPELYQLINEIIPKELFVFNKNNFAGLDEVKQDKYLSKIITSSIILKKNIFFSKYIMDITASSNNIKSEKMERYRKKMDNVNYKLSENSITEPSEEFKRGFAINIENKKKKLSNNIKDIMIKGSRNLLYRNQNNMDEEKSNDYLSMAEKAYFASRGGSSENVSASSERESKKESDKINKEMNSALDNLSENIKSVTSAMESDKAHDFVSKLSKIVKKNKNSKKAEMSMMSEDMKDEKKEEKELKRETSSITISSTPVKSELSGGKKKSKKDKKDKRKKDKEASESASNTSSSISGGYKNMMNPSIQNAILSQLPDGYSGQLPPHLDIFTTNMNQMGQADMTNPGMMANPMMNPNMMAQQMLSQVNPSMINPAMVGSAAIKQAHLPLTTMLPNNMSQGISPVMSQAQLVQSPMMVQSPMNLQMGGGMGDINDELSAVDEEIKDRLKSFFF